MVSDKSRRGSKLDKDEEDQHPSEGSDFDETKEDQDSSEGESKGLIGETIKKIFTVGVGAAFMTEDAVRSYLSELKLPKEILNLLLQSANKSKEEITQRVSKEMINVLKKIDIISEVSKFAENHKFKITAEIEVIKKPSKSPSKSPESAED